MLCSAAKIIIIINNKNKAKDFCYFCCMCIPYNCWAFYIFFGILLSFSLFTFRGVVFQTWASSDSKESACSAEDLGGEMPWRRVWLLIPIFWPGESHGQRNMVGCSSWGSQRVRPDWVTKHSTAEFQIYFYVATHFFPIKISVHLYSIIVKYKHNIPLNKDVHFWLNS